MRDIILYVIIRDRNSVSERAFTLTINIKSLATQLVKHILRYYEAIIIYNIADSLTITLKNLQKKLVIIILQR